MGQGDGVLVAPYAPSPEWTDVLSQGLSAAAVSNFIAQGRGTRDEGRTSSFSAVKNHDLDILPSDSESVSDRRSGKFVTLDEDDGWNYLHRLDSDDLPKLSIVGSAMATVLKFFVRQKMEYVGQCNVAIGGESWQLLRGEVKSFQIYMQDFCFRGMRTTEAELHTLDDGGGMKFNLRSAGTGGKLLERKVPMLLSVRESEADALPSLHRNNLLHKTVQECWNYIHGVSVAEYITDDAPDAVPNFPLPLPELSLKLADGLALFEEVQEDRVVASNGEAKNPIRFALNFSVERVGELEELVVSEVDWPIRVFQPEKGCAETELEGVRVTLAERAKWRKVVKMSNDIRFQSFSVRKGWFCYSYKFSLDL